MGTKLHDFSMVRRRRSSIGSRPSADPLLAHLFAAAVVQPLRIARSLAGPRIWPPLEQLAALLGTMGGLVARPLLGAKGPREHPMLPLLRFTEIVEGLLGIRGVNTLADDGSASRRVTHCPFAARLQAATPFCTSLGFRAGQEAFRRIVPGAEFEVLRTLSQGHECCEYRYVRRP